MTRSSPCVGVGRRALTAAVVSTIIRTMLELRPHARRSPWSCGAAKLIDRRQYTVAFSRSPAMACSTLGHVMLIVVATSMCLAACDFPRPADVPAPGDDAGAADTGASSSVCCVTAEECARIGANAPKPCLLGVCVRNECTATTGNCDGDEDCSGDTKFCVADTCSVCRVNATCPVSTPVCDDTSHSCRACAKDRECDSGACDLAAGTCVDGREILYASPAGTSADACTRLAPCSLGRAASLVDTAHMYIALLPGVHRSGAAFDGKTAIVAGNSATIDVAGSSIFLTNSASVKIRDIIVIQRQSLNIFGTRDAISVDNLASLAIDNMQATLAGGVNAVRSNGSLTIRASSISNGSVVDSGPIVIDRSTIANATLQLFLAGAAFEVSNSLFIGGSNGGGIFISEDTTSSQDDALVLNNTFIGGSISCQGTKLKRLESNIFQNATIITSSDCFYAFNLVSPSTDLGGIGNKSGDPMFVDAANNDFHLKAGSPAIDAANPSRAPPFGHDYDGVLRPQGAEADMGAFERVEPATSVAPRTHVTIPK